MSKTNALRKVIHAKLKSVCQNVYYENADNNAMYPHIVFAFSYGYLGDTAFARDDVLVTVDVWDRGKSAQAIENLADNVESLFNNSNAPQSDILPTFYLEGRQALRDEDPLIRHRLIRINVKNYER